MFGRQHFLCSVFNCNTEALAARGCYFWASAGKLEWSLINNQAYTLLPCF